MRPDHTVYTGERIEGPRGQFLGARVIVDGLPLLTPREHQVGYGFEWGYGGAGAGFLALSLLLDVLGNPNKAAECHTWFKWAVVANWGASWRITAGQIRRWVAQFDREVLHEEGEELENTPGAMIPTGCEAVRRCRVCGCTDFDCRQCIAATGNPCSWVPGEENLCTRCAAETAPTPVLTITEGGMP